MQVFYPDSTERSDSGYTVEIPDVTFEEVKTANSHTVFIDDSIGYSETVNTTKSVRSVSEKYLSVPKIKNKTTKEYPKGVCWASSSASIILFKGASSMSGEDLRDDLVNTEIPLVTRSGTYNPGTSEHVANMLNRKIPGVTYNYYNNEWPSFTEIQSKINDNIPIYMNWQSFNDSGVSQGAHATVLRGYYYNMSMPTNIPAAKKISMMDPNEEDSYISITYGT